MTKIIKVESCEKCPLLSKKYNLRTNNKYKSITKICIPKQFELKRTNKIPDWCPLDDLIEIKVEPGKYKTIESIGPFIGTNREPLPGEALIFDPKKNKDFKPSDIEKSPDRMNIEMVSAYQAYKTVAGKDNAVTQKEFEDEFKKVSGLIPKVTDTTKQAAIINKDLDIGRFEK